MSFKEIVSFRGLQKKPTALLLFLPFLAIVGIVFCYIYADPFDNDDLPDIALHNAGISYQSLNQVIFLTTLIQTIIITNVCINAICGRSPPQSILF